MNKLKFILAILFAFTIALKASEPAPAPTPAKTLGEELRFGKNISIAVDYRLIAWFNQDKTGQLRGFFNFRF